MRPFVAAYVAVLVVLAGLGLLGGVLLYQAYGPQSAAEAAADGHAYDFLTWEVKHFPRKWIYKVRHLWDEHSAADEEATLQRYFGLVAEISGSGGDERIRQASESAPRWWEGWRTSSRGA